MQADAGETVRPLVPGAVGIERLLQGGVARIAVAGGKPVLQVGALGLDRVRARKGHAEDHRGKADGSPDKR